VESTDLRAFPIVSLRLSAWNTEGLPLRDLKFEDFLIRENGGPAFAPDALSVDQNAPLAVALVLDISGSMRGQPIVDAKVAAARFLDRLSAADQAALIAFSDNLNPDPLDLDPTRELGFRGNLAALYDMIESLEAQGGTHLYNALAKAATLTLDLPSGHRAILLLSDGTNDPSNVGDPDAVIELAREANLPIYAIGLGSSIDEPYLRRLTAETGGVLRLAPSSAELAQTFEDMATLLKTQYVLRYTSKISNGADKASLEVTLNTLGMQATSQTMLENLPVLPTPTSAPVPTQMPTAVLATALPQPTAIPEPTAKPTGLLATLQQLPPALLFGLVGILTFVILLAMSVRRRKKAASMRCARCGFLLAEDATVCPQCGETRQLMQEKK